MLTNQLYDRGSYSTMSLCIILLLLLSGYLLILPIFSALY